MPERPITHDERMGISHWLSDRREQHQDHLRLSGNIGYFEGDGQIARIDGKLEPIILMSEFDPAKKVRQSYVVASENGFEILKKAGLIKPEISQELAKTVVGTD